MYTGLGSYQVPGTGQIINSPLSVDSVPYPDWRQLPANLSSRSVRDSGGRLVNVTSFMGGWLIDGCPLNVVYGEGWISGQQEALRAAGLTNCLPAAAAPTTPAGAPYSPVIIQAPTAGPALPFVPPSSGPTAAPAGQVQQGPPQIISLPGGGGPIDFGPVTTTTGPGLEAPAADYTPYLIAGGLVLAFLMFSGRRGK